MTDHPKVKGYKITQLGSTTNIAGLRTGSTAGHDLCQDLTSSEEAMMPFPSEIKGEDSSSSADPGQNWRFFFFYCFSCLKQ